jgi:UDP-N-acetylglucosamine 2-epimerase (non-hydrolysing)
MINYILGTRAQLIKMIPLIKRMEERGWTINLLHTGQHFQNMQEICDEFDIKSQWQPLYSGSEVNTVPQALKWMSHLLLQAIFNPAKKLNRSAHKKDVVLVHGDTFSTVLGALIGKRANMQVAHIESGLRSFNIWHPFPEELNRLMTFRLTDLAFCPGNWACDNLQRYSSIKKINTGSNTLIDTLKLAQQRNQKASKLIRKERYAVCSIHRFENIYHKSSFVHIIELLEFVSRACRLVFVLHPTTKKRLIKTGLINVLKNIPAIELIERMGYADFVHLITHSHFVITDGGSNQEELSYLGIPTLLMRKTTERPEGLGFNTVISDFSEKTIKIFLDNVEHYRVKTVNTDEPCDVILRELEMFC